MSSKDKVAEAASRLLADSYTLYLKTHNFHWNVTGPIFTTLHTLRIDIHEKNAWTLQSHLE